MKILSVVDGLGLAIAAVITISVVLAVNRSRRARDARHVEAAATRLAAQEEERRRAARLAAEKQARRLAEEGARREAEAEGQRLTEQERRRAEEQVRRAADEQARRDAGERAQREAEAERQRLAAQEQERRRVEEQTRRAAEEQAQRDAEESAQREAEAERQRLAAREQERRGAEEQPRSPRQYQTSARSPVPPGTPRRVAPAEGERGTRDRALPIDVRLIFERAGFCRVTLLPRRTSGLPVEVTVTGSGGPPELIALQENWYQDVVLPNAGRLLREGIEWAGGMPDGQKARWSLSGREIYVLARHNELNGFVSAPRLILGEEQAVLCTADRLADVRSAIALTGSPEPVLLDGDSGVPDGWVGVRGIVPNVAVAPSADGEILDALRPLAEVEIALEGGIRIERQTWLSGFPPCVRLRGDSSAIDVVKIDGRDATSSQDGSYVLPGWDSVGDHNVWCTSGSRTYAIRDGAEDWESWDAYTWSLGEPRVDGVAPRPGICGVLVRPPRVAHSGGRAIVVATSNPVLIGANPGEIEVCAPRGDVRAGQCVGFPWFEPVWAIPADSLHCDKRLARVQLIGTARPVAADEQRTRRDADRQPLRRQGVYAWCEAIRMAGRKGLETQPHRSDVTDLWRAYKKYARVLWKSMR